MARSPFLMRVLLISVLCVPSVAEAGPRPKAEPGRLERSYDANDWHMKRFMSEYVWLERLSASDPDNAEFKKRFRELKMQIDVLSRENERILDSLDKNSK